MNREKVVHHVEGRGGRSYLEIYSPLRKEEREISTVEHQEEIILLHGKKYIYIYIEFLSINQI